MRKALSPKHRRFVSEYLKDQNAKQAAIRAGYSPKAAEANGPRLLRNARVWEEIKKRLEKIENKAEISVEYVLKNLKEVAERCMVHQPVMVRDGRDVVQKTEFVEDENGETKEVGVWDFDSMGANKALELLGKHLKMFTEKHEVAGKDGGPIVTLDFSRIDDETLRRLADGK